MAGTRELRIGVIGAGGRGGLAGHAHHPEQGVRLAAAADTDAAALERFRENYGPDVFTTSDYRRLLDQDLDAVFVTTPDFLHEEHAVAAMEAGKDVYCEKPMAITIEGCDRMLATAVRTGRKLFVGHNMRHMSFVQKMREIISSGRIGEIKAAWCRHFISYGGDAYFKDWHADRSKSTGLLLQKGVHDIDVIHYLCGGFSRRVTGMGGLTLYGRITDRHSPAERGDASFVLDNWPPLSQKGMNPVLDVEDLSMMLMALDNGIFASYQQCHYTPDAWRNYTFIGTAGRIENFNDAPGACVIRVWNRRTDYNPYGDEQYFIPRVSGGHGGADPSIVDEFIRHIRDGEKTSTSAVAARQSVAAGYLATCSIREGGVPYDIPPIPEEIVRYFAALCT